MAGVCWPNTWILIVVLPHRHPFWCQKLHPSLYLISKTLNKASPLTPWAYWLVYSHHPIRENLSFFKIVYRNVRFTISIIQLHWKQKSSVAVTYLLHRWRSRGRSRSLSSDGRWAGKRCTGPRYLCHWKTVTMETRASSTHLLLLQYEVSKTQPLTFNFNGLWDGWLHPVLRKLPLASIQSCHFIKPLQASGRLRINT